MNRDICGTCMSLYNSNGKCECFNAKSFKHKHHDVVIAYLNGTTIETYAGPKFGWLEINNIAESQDVPCFPSSIEYRIKNEQ
jgi:hypothetical protein